MTDAEAAALAAYLSMSVPAFAGQYTRLRDDRRGLALAERPDGACIFLQDAPVSCRIQLVKPKQCREFPFTWRYEDLERVCPAARH